MDWLPLIIAAVVGIVIGVIATMIPFRRRGDEYAYRIRDVESKLKNTDRDLTDSRGQIQALTTNTRAIETTLGEAQTKLQETEALYASTQTELAESQSQLAEVQASLQKVNDEKAGVEAALQQRLTDLDGLNASLASLQSQFDETNSKVAALTTDLDGAHASIATFKANEEATAQALVSKDTELEGLQKTLAEVGGAKEMLEAKLKNTRSEVAAELAILTSTMIKLKEEQLGETEGKLHDLQKQLAALKDGQPVAE
jgi:putative ABC transport system permease protein